MGVAESRELRANCFDILYARSNVYYSGTQKIDIILFALYDDQTTMAIVW